MDAELPLTPDGMRASDFVERRVWETARDLTFVVGFDEARAQVQKAADAFALEGDRSRVLFCIAVVHIIELLRRKQVPNECRRSQTHEYLG